MSPIWLGLIAGFTIAAPLVILWVSHAGKAAVRADWVDADVPGDVQ